MRSTMRSSVHFMLLVGGVGLAASLSSLHGNFVYRPPPSVGQPRALVHFLGGAFIGAAPQAGYSQLLRQFSEAGFVCLATPYETQFDYLDICEKVLATAEPAVAQLRAEYGELPLIGMGHSCGALLHVLIGSLFQGTK